jgi:hypothetical protein
MKSNQFIIIATKFIIVMMILMGCVLIPSNTAPPIIQADSTIAEQTPFFELPPEWTKTFTQEPTKTITPIPSATNTPSCDAEGLIAEIKSSITYEEYVVTYNILQIQGRMASLVIWFVDPEIDPSARGIEIEQNSELARKHAAIISNQINVENYCVASLFDVINPIVVDSNYNGWFSGEIKPSKLIDEIEPSTEQIIKIENEFKIGYLRTNPTEVFAESPTGSCTWKEANANLHNHFSSTRENVGFYFVLDDEGTNVWTQWDGPTDLILMSASLLNVTMELECLYPRPDRVIVIIVDEKGIVGLIGVIPGINAGGFQIAYQR